MFVDEKKLLVRAGKGGDGAALFRREKYVPYGGPDGGDGGRGGDLILVGQGNLHAFNHLARTDRIEAEDGQPGGHQRSSGPAGKEAILAVPLGTIVEVKKGEEYEHLLEVTEEGQQIRLAKGGNGGWGNWHFKSSIQQAPERHNDGQPGEMLELRLTLKLIADIGLVGLPNAGKSTLLSAVSAAKPKIANYPFTTLEPQLGVLNLTRGRETQQLVIADLPGLIEGASDGKGLGQAFLRHIERTKMIIHCIDCTASPEEVVENYKTIRKELASWSEVLADKPERIALTKSELLPDDERKLREKALAKITKSKIITVSAVTHQHLTELFAGLE